MGPSADQARDLAAADLGGKLAQVHAENGTTFTVYGWPFAIMRNGADAWDLLGPKGLIEALEVNRLADEIREQVEDLNDENMGGWEDPPPMDWGTP